MSPREAVEEVNDFFVYEPDGKIDHWSFKSPGDCENYSLLVLKKIAGSQRTAARWLITGRAHMWYVKTLSGAGHTILEYEDRFVDNRMRKWCGSLDEMGLLPHPRKRYSKPQLVAKLGVGALLF